MSADEVVRLMLICNGAIAVVFFVGMCWLVLRGTK